MKLPSKWKIKFFLLFKTPFQWKYDVDRLIDVFVYLHERSKRYENKSLKEREEIYRQQMEELNERVEEKMDEVETEVHFGLNVDLKSEKKREMEKQQEEQASPSCPNCGSDEVEEKEIREDNGVIGPGFSSWSIDNFFVCQECGIRFEKLNKDGN